MVIDFEVKYIYIASLVQLYRSSACHVYGKNRKPYTARNHGNFLQVYVYGKNRKPYTARNHGNFLQVYVYGKNRKPYTARNHGNFLQVYVYDGQVWVVQSICPDTF